jgi:succinate dehydrogenase hydrophobic anchor subunit
MIYFSITKQGGTNGNVQNNLSHFILYIVGAVFVLVYVITVVSFLINLRNRQMMVNEYVSHLVSSMWLLMCP